MCEHCKSYGDIIVISPKPIEFIVDYWFKVKHSNLDDDDEFCEFVNKLLVDYANGDLDYEKLERFTYESYNKTIEVENVCNKCKHKNSTLRICFTYAIYRSYYEMLYRLFMEAFKEKYHADGSFLIENKEHTGYVARQFFDQKDLSTIALFRLIEIENIIPNEKGGPGEELLIEAVKTIVFGLLSNFLYEVIKSNVRIVKKNVKNMASEYIKSLENNRILNDLREYMKSENVEWNENIATILVHQRLDNLIGEYINSIYEEDS